MTVSNLRVNLDRLCWRLDELARIGAIEGGGVCRLALSDEDRRARDLVIQWMHELQLEVTVDQIGNIVGLRKGQEQGRPVMTGSHIDTVATGGCYDGNLGVLAGLEVIATLNDAAITTRRPLAVGVFTNEEGVRFQPDMMGSSVHQGLENLDVALAAADSDGLTLGDELKNIGYSGDIPVGSLSAHCFVELHVEQGPVLETAGIAIGAVESVQGISWTELTISGVANHAGTTPMSHRHDAGLVAAAIAVEVRKIAEDMGGNQVATVGCIELVPNLINVIAREARISVDLRNTDGARLCEAERRLEVFVERISAEEDVEIKARRLARFDPVTFDAALVGRIEKVAGVLDHSIRRMPSGAGHDAQMFAPNCPSAMIFVPSKNGISHNVEEYTSPEEIRAGADILLQVLISQSA